ncbi:hypothetical protein FE784_05540 [Paenibacillus hemerocallicola]|uniref:Uncharacterized protein n=1 Tax=Paenibacillus hemerocallicola TaxID=1172614 RepID=A0A5C4TEL6_9BACL|nr:hypothetical protein [Paenibacillus hemerocallicola]TNJ67418.1 hypothetical protein FE784_05540 [Paenibacillus hemerocallicola]
MKMGAFLLGGLVGAAAVVYFNNSRSLSFAGLSNRSNQSAGKTARSGKTQTHTTGNKFSGSEWNGAGLEDVEELIKKDPTVKTQVDEIMNKSEKSYMTQ